MKFDEAIIQALEEIPQKEFDQAAEDPAAIRLLSERVTARAVELVGPTETLAWIYQWANP